MGCPSGSVVKVPKQHSGFTFPIVLLSNHPSLSLSLSNAFLAPSNRHLSPQFLLNFPPKPSNPWDIAPINAFGAFHQKGLSQFSPVQIFTIALELYAWIPPTTSKGIFIPFSQVQKQDPVSETVP